MKYDPTFLKMARDAKSYSPIMGFSSNQALGIAAAAAVRAEKDNLPMGYGANDLIDGMRDMGWITCEGGSFHITNLPADVFVSA